MAHGDSTRGRDALRSLDFFAQADLFMTPTAELADIVLPVTTPFESEALKIGFEYSQKAQSLVQLRQPIVPPRGEARSDLQIVFDLATRLGLGAHFWDGDIEAAFRHQLAPIGVTLDELRADPAGVRVPLTTRYRKYAAKGFATASRKVELYSATLAAHGYSPLPAFEEPLTSPRSRPDLADRYPLVLSCAKSVFFCETQHRQVAALRKSAPDPQLETHPSTAAARGISAGDWVALDTPHGSVRARAKFNASRDPEVVFGQHGCWRACDELELPGSSFSVVQRCHACATKVTVRSTAAWTGSPGPLPVMPSSLVCILSRAPRGMVHQLKTSSAREYRWQRTGSRRPEL